MKRIISAVLVLCISLCFLSSCSEKEEILKLMKNEEGLLQGEGGVLYDFAPPGYEPVNQGEEYALLSGTLEEPLYKIGEFDPSQWLTTEYTGSATLVYYNIEIDLPSLSEMNIETCYICEEDVNTMAIAVIGGEDTQDRDADREIIAKIISAVTDESTESELWPRMDSNASYRLKMYSPDWPAVYYTLVYSVCDSGNYIYDRVTGKCVSIGDLLEPYLGLEAD